MQKRPYKFVNQKPEVSLIFDTIEFDPEFPVFSSGLHIPDSGPLTFVHYHDCFEIGFCYKGSGIFIVDDKIIPFSEGDASIIFRNEIHIAKSNPEDISSWKFTYIDPVKLLQNTGMMLTSSLFACLGGSPGFSNIVHGQDNPRLVGLIREIIDEGHDGKDMYTLSLTGLVMSLLAKLNRIVPWSDSHTIKSRRSAMVRLSPALDFIYRNYAGSIDVPDLAAMCDMSVTNFRRTFKDAMGMSPLSYIIHIKIRMASVLLTSTDLPVTEVSQLSGFDTLSVFNRHFRKIMEMSPREWRRNASQ